MDLSSVSIRDGVWRGVHAVMKRVDTPRSGGRLEMLRQQLSVTVSFPGRACQPLN